MKERPALMGAEAKARIRELLEDSGTRFLKVQTTGVGADARIISLTLMDTFGGFSRFVFNPGFDIEPITEKLTGLRNDVLKNGMSWAEWHDELKDAFSKAKTIVAWNMSFDRAKIENEQLLASAVIEDVVGDCSFVDAMELFSGAVGKDTKYTKLMNALGHPTPVDPVENLLEVRQLLEREAGI